MESFDVVIVGAGPAGLRCAEILGGSRFRVLVLEKKAEIGPKICAGGLTKKTLDCLNFPTELLDFQTNKIKLHLDGLFLEIKQKDNFIYGVSRKRLGQWQLGKLKQFQNIEIRTKAFVSKIKEGKVFVNNRPVAYKFLVGADGSASVVRRHLKIGSKKIGIARQYLVPVRANSGFEFFYDQSLFAAWFVWIFPHQNYVSIGCGADPGILPFEKLAQNLKKWLKKNDIDVSQSKEETFVINYDFRGYQFGNVFLVGDAAGFASSLTGEGIYQAVVSGEEIAKIILQPGYQSRKLDKILRLKVIHERLMNRLISSDFSRSTLFRAGAFLIRVPYLGMKIFNFLI
ncbi:MAG: NAD(P)/FAD-dependent oxidoreductase [Candidatus Pacebacteria bacterium]|nr:NAD(P)/FAD-dependent oxidoreductase [Candidatus Paceibacterota bacterium]